MTPTPMSDALFFDTGPLRHFALNGWLGVQCSAIREGQLTVRIVEALADDLISGEYFLPFGPGGFRRWAQEERHIEYE
ncbi:hypothetical protein ABZT47_00915 [Sphaerisporangium sp. NPDC005289]|uniref:hypothetical protein n=1 Tax=Sphaerisporangium sp. NPDC005289 TaxID=3155247 RepID=UPI0033AF5BD3